MSETCNCQRGKFLSDQSYFIRLNFDLWGGVVSLWPAHFLFAHFLHKKKGKKKNQGTGFILFACDKLNWNKDCYYAYICVKPTGQGERNSPSLRVYVPAHIWRVSKPSEISVKNRSDFFSWIKCDHSLKTAGPRSGYFWMQGFSFYRDTFFFLLHFRLNGGSWLLPRLAEGIYIPSSLVCKTSMVEVIAAEREREGERMGGPISVPSCC